MSHFELALKVHKSTQKISYIYLKTTDATAV